MCQTELNLPRSDQSVRVRLVDTTTQLAVEAWELLQPVQAGHTILNLTCVAFLIEHEPTGQKLMFDLGLRKDYWNLPAPSLKRLATGPGVRVDKGTTEVLEENGVSLQSISAVIWSHYHFDHVGDVSLFPATTELIVGPGVKAAPFLLPGYPEDINSPISSSHFKGREVREIDFQHSNLQVGGFSAVDFFGDGSFYLLNTPGHCLGHLCGLARTTAGSESTFVLLGGDICHFPGVLRPSARTPIPRDIPGYVLDPELRRFPSCPCEVFVDNHPVLSSDELLSKRCTTPFYRAPTRKDSAYTDPKIAQQSIEKVLEFDSSPSVFVCLAHDPALLKFLPTLNEDLSADLNNWRPNGYKERCFWDWLNALPRDRRPGRNQIVRGFWKDGKAWEEGKEELTRVCDLALGSGTA